MIILGLMFWYLRIGNCVDKIPRIVFSYWEDETNLPADVEEMINVSKNSLANFTYILLTEKNKSRCLDIALFPNFYHNLTKTHKGDYIRICLIEKYGGVYIDASVYVTSGTAMEWFFYEGITSRAELFGFAVWEIYICNNLFGGIPRSKLLSSFKKEFDEALSKNGYDYCKKVVFMLDNRKKKKGKNYSNYECWNLFWAGFCFRNRLLVEETAHIMTDGSYSFLRLPIECSFDPDCVRVRLVNDPVVRSYPFIKVYHHQRLGRKLYHWNK